MLPFNRRPGLSREAIPVVSSVPPWPRPALMFSFNLPSSHRYSVVKVQSSAFSFRRARRFRSSPRLVPSLFPSSARSRGCFVSLAFRPISSRPRPSRMHLHAFLPSLRPRVFSNEKVPRFFFCEGLPEFLGAFPLAPLRRVFLFQPLAASRESLARIALLLHQGEIHGVPGQERIGARHGAIALRAFERRICRGHLEHLSLLPFPSVVNPVFWCFNEKSSSL